MTNSFRGGNSRSLAKLLDQLDGPVAILDGKGHIQFANAALCRSVAAEATQLVGKPTSWEIPLDSSPFGSLLSACAPPAAVRSGEIVLRKLSTPIVPGSPHTGQLFLPLIGEDSLVQLTLVHFGDIERLEQQVPSANDELESADFEYALTQLRSRWQKLDGLLALAGTSPSIQLAMRRTQLAAGSNESIWISGPSHVGKRTVSQSIFASKLQLLELNPAAGQYFPVDCGALDAELLDSMLDVFVSRVRSSQESGQPQQLVLERVDEASNDACAVLSRYAFGPLAEAQITAISQTSPRELASRSPAWKELVHRVAVHDIEIPGLADRREDIGVLAQHFMSHACKEQERAMLTLSAEAMDMLLAFRWPSNLRQIADAMQFAVQHAVLTRSIQPSHLPVEIRTFCSHVEAEDDKRIEPVPLDDLLLELERIIISRALKLSPRNRAQVARWLEISRPRLLRRIEQLGLDTSASADEDAE